MRDITQLHVKGLGLVQSSANILDSRSECFAEALNTGDGVSGTATAGLSDTEHLSSGDCACNQASPADSKVLDVAGQLALLADKSSGIAPVGLVGTGGEVVAPHPPSPLQVSTSLQEVTPMRDESQKSGLRLANGCGEKRPDNTHIDMKLTYENPAICERRGGVEGQPIEAPPLNFPADDRFADNICRALDAAELAEQYRLEDIEAEREHNMFLASGYPDAGVRRV